MHPLKFFKLIKLQHRNIYSEMRDGDDYYLQVLLHHQYIINDCVYKITQIRNNRTENNV